MNIKAKAGRKILTEQREKYRLNLLHRDNDSPALILARVEVLDGEETYSTVAELDMSGIFEQVFHLVTGA